MEKIAFIGFYTGLLLLIYITGSRIKPYKPAWTLLERGLLGVGIIFVWNLLAAPMHLSVSLNPITALVAGALGAPGLGLLLIIKVM